MGLEILLILLGLISFGLLIGLIIIKRRHQQEIAEVERGAEEEIAAAEAKSVVQENQSKVIEERLRRYEDRIKSLNELLAAKQDELRKTEEGIKEAEDKSAALKNYLSELDKNVNDNRELLDNVNKKHFETLEAQKQLDETIRNSKEQQEKIVQEIELSKKELEELKEKKRLAVLYQNETENKGGEFLITPHEKELISMLERIKMDYAELRTDIATIEWKRVWMPKIQDIVSRNGLDGKRCIYRLVLKENEEICYVGQAVNVKERGYQHIKKMIGVDAVGNEKLYEYRPDDFWGTIVEENPESLNESEHYWIEYFGCKEKGLNRKR